MPDRVHDYFNTHGAVAARVAQELAPKIVQIGTLLCDTLAAGGKILTFGNGGSAADAQHLAEELLGRFQRTRRPLPAISLTADGTALTCIANDFGYEEVFARQVTALARAGDVCVGFSTSGNSPNVIRALQAARQQKAVTIALLGRGGGKIAAEVDHSLIIPAATHSHFIQEMHMMIVHLLCDMVDRWAAGEAV